MHGKFDDNMSFSGNTLTVCGPIFWNGTKPTDLPASAITILHVTVFQPGGVKPFFVNPNQALTPGGNEWMVDVTGSWAAGRASAVAFVRLAYTGRAREGNYETWSESLTIFEA